MPPRNPSLAATGGRENRREDRVTTAPERLLQAFRQYLGALSEPVPSRFLEGLGEPMQARDLALRTLDCLAHLDRIAASAPPESHGLIRLLADHRDQLVWGQTYTAADFGQHFIDNYGWLELIGTRGHFESEEIAAGFLILGPGVHYPDHHHAAEEIYVPLAGEAEWRKGNGSFLRWQPGEVIHHPSNVSHAMRTGSEPLLALYLWRGGPLAQRSVIAPAETEAF
ncbi:cupin domain-containing protein [Pseudaminobacter sp. 19-2017]|uniref:Cupin domain-containing protein n=1 Tax=Pseudaminobacter soli (ex Zhang et al. 2022) TaxID=2831468 RepID=A0A942DXL2_9HYPH|nr:cupin domain-containing protein [Pseudaminobacter soli]